MTILTNAMVIGRGSRRRMLDALDPARVTMQVSLDSGTPELHDRHRGAGAFDRARAGIALLRELGFRVRVAATVDEADAAEEAGFHALLDADGIPPEDRLVRRVARAGFADHGARALGRHALARARAGRRRRLVAPRRIAEPDMQVASTPLPLVTVLAVIRATLNDPDRDRSAALAAFRCT